MTIFWKASIVQMAEKDMHNAALMTLVQWKSGFDYLFEL